MIPRETATHAPDLPHAYEPGEDDVQCTVCEGVAADPLHVAHQQRKAAQHERASATEIPREFG